MRLLDASSLLAVRTVLDDATVRLLDAIDDPSVRGQVSRGIVTVQRDIAAGQLDAAETAVARLRGDLTRAAAQDPVGSWSADVAAIDLALGVVADEIVRSRRPAAGGIQ